MMSKEKWIESLLDDMVESQWSEDIIRQEYERFNKLAEAKDFQSIDSDDGVLSQTVGLFIAGE